MELNWSEQSVGLVVGVLASLLAMGAAKIFPWGWRRRKEWTAKKAAEMVEQANAIGRDAGHYFVRVAETILLALDAIFSLALATLLILLSAGSIGWWHIVANTIGAALFGRSLVNYYLFQKEVRIAKQAVRNQPCDVVDQGERKE